MIQQTILVTGGSGFIGVETCKQLVAAGYNVINIDRNRKKKEIAGVTHYPFDIANSQVKGIIQLTRPDAIIHLAAEHEVERSFTEPGVYFHNNISNTIELLNHAAEAGVKKFIFASSSSVYGNRQTTEGSYVPTAFREDEPFNALSPYSKSKQVIEELLPAYEAAYGIKSVVLRYHNAAGASKDLKHGYTQKPHAHLIPIVCHAAIHGETVTVNRDMHGESTDSSCFRDYTHLVDVARSNLDAIKYLENGESNTFNIGRNEPHDAMYVIQKLNTITNKPISSTMGPPRKGDPMITNADLTKTKKLLGWKPAYAIDDIILDAYNWELKQK